MGGSTSYEWYSLYLSSQLQNQSTSIAHRTFSSEKGGLKAVQTSFLNFFFVMEEEKDK
jgi:hypothetical protein